MTLTIAVQNHSTLVADVYVTDMVAAVGYQLHHDVAPRFNRTAPKVEVVGPKAAPSKTVAVIGLFDDSDQAGALGYHSEEQGGALFGKVFAKPTLDNGGQLLNGPLSVSSVLSHEVIELFGDPNVNLWADNGTTTGYAYELCDPVESDSYDAKAPTALGVMVSNFVLPAWFDALNTAGPFDHLGHLAAPFTMSKGGYLIKRKEGAEGQVFADFGLEYPGWRKATKDHALARTRRRLTGAVI